MDEDLGANRIGVILVELEPGMKSAEIHYHKEREGVYVVLQGNATLMLNGTEHQLKPETFVFLSPGDKHGITSTGNETFRMIEVYSPLGPDRVVVQ